MRNPVQPWPICAPTPTVPFPLPSHRHRQTQGLVGGSIRFQTILTDGFAKAAGDGDVVSVTPSEVRVVHRYRGWPARHQLIRGPSHF
ncbi:hypothetical protein DMH04_26670 [Kibdelosporangium aridum]|uniref:Uncharacterized protein n=1 Tax=Kibdelosporangium aridum TaxID=2030 RepID=A0A428Z545_KIBAR|nr:hypothetical protein [Kibdelosporangium aridum]RSM81932.1 hypothetical protein DMH04_26670 [Kibdelosporangium aridum]